MYAIYTVTAIHSMIALHTMTVMHTMHTMNTMTGSYGIRAMHAKKTEIPKDSSRGPLQAVYGRIGILVWFR